MAGTARGIPLELRDSRFSMSHGCKGVCEHCIPTMTSTSSFDHKELSDLLDHLARGDWRAVYEVVKGASPEVLREFRTEPFPYHVARGTSALGGYTLLHALARVGPHEQPGGTFRARAIAQLVQYSTPSEVDVRDFADRTALHHAFESEFDDAATILLAAGADPLAQNSDGQDPLAAYTLAAWAHPPEVQEAFLDHIMSLPEITARVLRRWRANAVRDGHDDLVAAIDAATAQRERWSGIRRAWVTAVTALNRR